LQSSTYLISNPWGELSSLSGGKIGEKANATGNSVDIVIKCLYFFNNWSNPTLVKLMIFHLYKMLRLNNRRTARMASESYSLNSQPDRVKTSGKQNSSLR
jgi:hypothetical protein